MSFCLAATPSAADLIVYEVPLPDRAVPDSNHPAEIEHPPAASSNFAAPL